MTVHRYHPDPDRGDPPDAQLYDDCERCAEQADTLWGLDETKLAWFWSAMHHLERLDDPPTRPLTSTERKAFRRLYQAAIVFERLTGKWPSPNLLLAVSQLDEPDR